MDRRRHSRACHALPVVAMALGLFQTSMAFAQNPTPQSPPQAPAPPSAAPQSGPPKPAVPDLTESPSSEALILNTSVFLTDYPADRFLLPAQRILSFPMGQMLMQRFSDALKRATPKTCVVPEPEAPKDATEPKLTAQDKTDEMIVLGFAAVIENIENARWAHVDAALRDDLMRKALTDAEFEIYRTVIRSQGGQDAMLITEFRLGADAAVELGIALDRYLIKARYPVNGPVNALETREGLELFDRILEQVEDAFVSIKTKPQQRADLEKLVEFEAKRALALIDMPPGQELSPATVPLRPKLKHIKENVALDTEDIWAPLGPLFTRLCIERRPVAR
ncbi:MAG: hypothetical protein RL291_1754 [Pseudomonadota bacterium]